MEEEIAVPQEKRATGIGFAMLILMQLLGLASVFYSIYLLDDDTAMPRDRPGWIWSFVSSFGILFPFLTTHFHTINRHRSTGWFSWWLGVTALFSIILLLLCGVLGEGLHESETNRIFTFYIAAVIGGSLGAILVQGIVRRFLPRLLNYTKAEKDVSRKSFGIKTILFWITAIAVIGSIYSNAEKIGIEIFPSVDNSLPVALLIGFIWGIVLTLFLWLPLTKWMQSLRPFWLSVVSLALITGLSTMAIIAFITAISFHIETGIYWPAKCLSMQLAFIVLIVGLWICACRRAGLVASKVLSKEERKRKGVVRKSLSAINWLSQRLIWLCAAASLLYASVWTWIHFASGGEERNILSVTKGTLTEQNNLLDVANKRWSEKISPEQNVIVGIINALDPIRNNVDANAYYRELGIDAPAVKAVEEPKPFDMMSNVEDDKQYRYQQSIRNRLFDSDGYPKEIEGISAEERHFMETISYSIDMSMFEDAPWNREMCEPAADFLDEHQSQLQTLRELSKQKQFFSPWIVDSTDSSKINDLGSDVLDEALRLLKMSAMYHLGNDRVEKAIEDCLAMDRLVKPEWTSQIPNMMLKEWRFKLRKSVADTLLQITFHPKVTSLQLEEIEKVVKDRESKSPEGIDEEFRDALVIQLAIQEFFRIDASLKKEGIQKHAPFRSWYVEHPTTIDWMSWRDSFEQVVSKDRELLEAGYAGQIGIEERRKQRFGISTREGIKIENLDFYNYVLGHKLLTFVRGPKYKGQVLGAIAADRVLRFTDFGVYEGQRDRDFLLIAIALKRWSLQHGSLPETLEQLVPEFLTELPIDSISQKPFVYQRKAADYLLYSVGSDGIDDGGIEYGDMIFVPPYPDLIQHHFNSQN